MQRASGAGRVTTCAQNAGDIIQRETMDTRTRGAALTSIRHWRMLSRSVEFIETPTFTRLVLALMADDDYARLQAALALRPGVGKIVPAGGGIRKVRWAARGRGKRGGLRFIYYWQTVEDRIWMLFVYSKSERDDLSLDQLRQLRILVKEFLV